MDKGDIQIGNEIRRIVGLNGLRFPVMSGVVNSVDSDDMTCEVALTAGDDATPTDGVLLNVKLNNTKGIYMLPAKDADCIVAEVDGPGQLMQLLWASEYDKVYVSAGTLIQFNDGGKGGIPIVGKVGDNFDTLKKYIKETLEPKIEEALTNVGAGSACDGPGAAATFTTDMATELITFEDMENKNVTHG